MLGRTAGLPPSVLDGSPPPAGGPNGTFTISHEAEWNSGSQLKNTVATMTGIAGMGGGLTIGTALAAPAQMINSQLWLNGTTTWDGNQDIKLSNSTINNAGTFTIANAQKIVDVNNAQPSSFINTGSLLKQAGAGPTTLNVAFTNQGSFKFNGTTIVFESTAQQTAAGAVTDLGGGTMSLLDPVTQALLTFTLSAGRLTGSAGATINGSLSNNGVVDFANVVGTLKITGDYTQTGSGYLRILVGMGGADILRISGKATLDGHLGVQGMRGGAAFDFLQAAGGVFGIFADVTIPWQLTYFANDVWVQ